MKDAWKWVLGASVVGLLAVIVKNVTSGASAATAGGAYVDGQPQSVTYRGVSIASAIMAPGAAGGWSYEVNGPANYPLPLATFRGAYSSSAAAIAGGQAEVDQQYAGGWSP